MLTANNGKKALDLYLQEKRKMALVILDLIMHEMEVSTRSRELLKIGPQVKVLIVSGFSAAERTSGRYQIPVQGIRWQAVSSDDAP